MPLCSCGVVPATLSLRKSGASEGASVAFLISTPQTGLDSVIATYGLLGIVFAVFTPFATLFTGIAGGLLTLIWRGKQKKGSVFSAGMTECSICFISGPHRHSLAEKTVRMAKYAYHEFLDDISVRLAIGIALSAVIALAVPDDFFSKYLRNDFLSMLLMIAVGIPLYVCATASLPIALALIDKGISPGAALVFLTVGPATNAATIMLIASAMGKRVVTIYISSVAIMAIINGYILNAIFKVTGAPLPVIQEVHSHASSHAPLATLFALLFAIIFAASLFRQAKERLMPLLARATQFSAGAAAAAAETSEYSFTVNGMTCARCQRRVTNALRAVNGVVSVSLDLTTGCTRVRTRGTVSFEKLTAAVERAGYKATDKNINN
jgi:hypothetical protein